MRARDVDWQIAILFLGLLAGGLPAPARADPFEDLSNEANGYLGAGEPAKAQAAAERLLKMVPRYIKAHPTARADALWYLGRALWAQDRNERAAELLKEALPIHEKVYGPDHLEVAWTLFALGQAYADMGDYAAAEKPLRRALAIREKHFAADHEQVAKALAALGHCLYNLDRSTEAVPLLARAVAALAKTSGRDDLTLTRAQYYQGLASIDTGDLQAGQKLAEYALASLKQFVRVTPVQQANYVYDLALVYYENAHYDEALLRFKSALAVYEKEQGPDSSNAGDALAKIAAIYADTRRYDQARAAMERALAIAREHYGKDQPEVAYLLNDYADGEYAAAKYPRAQELYKQALAILEHAVGVDDADIAAALYGLGNAYADDSRYADAEPAYKRSLELLERADEPDAEAAARALVGLAYAYYGEGRLGEAEPIYRRAIGMIESLPEKRPYMLGDAVHSLASVYVDQGRFAMAEPLCTRAVKILEKEAGGQTSDYAFALTTLAELYREQGRYAEAERLFLKAKEIHAQVEGPKSIEVAYMLADIAWSYYDQERFAEAEPLYRQALAVYQAARGADHVDCAVQLMNIGEAVQGLGRYEEAAALFDQARAVFEKSLNRNNPLRAWLYRDVASLAFARGDAKAALPLVDRAVRSFNRTGLSPAIRYEGHLLRARILWQLKQQSEALDDLREAMDLAELQRGQTSGAERERAKFFAQFSSAFEQMIAWQLELGNEAEAARAMERGRARSLLDELRLSGADLDLGRSGAERQRERAREAELKSRIAGLEKQLADLADSGNKQPAGAAARRAKVQQELAEARRALYESFRDQRSSSSIYRNLLGTGSGPPRLSQLQESLLHEGGTLLLYYFGEDGGYVLAVTRDRARLHALTVDDDDAATLGVDPGPLTADKLGAVMSRADGRGVVQLLARPQRPAAAIDKLAVLYQELVPEEVRADIAAHRIEPLLVIPDGALALLPFDALVVDHGPKTVRYLLDAGPPILCGPSATVLYNLAEPHRSTRSDQVEPLLTMGDPLYDRAGAAAQAGSAPTTLDQLATGTRFSALGGTLTALPYSGIESNWVAQVFAKHGFAATRLVKGQATEARLRDLVAGREFVHLACHGFADQSYGNFFGALAVAPGADAAVNPANDGFLSLAEICELDLKQCELAILSACETNFGPQQRGEGVWSLARGFLVAGARRVVASNWLVDDKAAASLVAAFCTKIAQSCEENQPTDYARALQEAKRWIRGHEKWQSPYYWASFSLIGPR